MGFGDEAGDTFGPVDGKGQQHQGSVRVFQSGVAFAQVRFAGRLDGSERRRREFDRTLCHVAASGDLHEHGSLVVAGLAHVHPFDTPRVPDVRMAHLLRLVDVPERHVVPGGQIASFDRDIFRFGQAVAAMPDVCSPDEQVRRHHRRQARMVSGSLSREFTDPGAHSVGQLTVADISARPPSRLEVVAVVRRVRDAHNRDRIVSGATRDLYD